MRQQKTLEKYTNYIFKVLFKVLLHKERYKS